MTELEQAPMRGGPIAWMVHNRVTPNLLMIVLIGGGLIMSTQIRKEVFPSFDMDMVTVFVAYPGASPAEVEQGIILAVEDTIQNIEGVKELTATASEGSGRVQAELQADADRQKVLQDIKQEIDRITTFPLDAEEPVVSLASRRRQVLSIQLFGDVSEKALREVAEQVRDSMLQNPEIAQVDVVGGRNYEIAVEVPMESLRAYGLTLSKVASAIRAASVELPGGKLETSGGEILLRIKNRRDWAREFGRIPIISTPQGTIRYLEDIADVRESFEDTNRFASYNGKPSIGLSVHRVGEQTPIGVSEAARNTIAEIEPDLPPGIDWQISSDRSEIYQQRLRLLLKNACIGLILVLSLLGLFLEIRLAFWVTMGIPISFLGAMLFLPMLDVSINIISMFAFIIGLGIVVDDAIVAGENIYEHRQKGMGFVEAAIRGARDVSMPIGFAIITNVIAFLPLYFVPGVTGKIWRTIPIVVIMAFLISWVESLLILPTHLSHSKNGPAGRVARVLYNKQQAFSRGVYGFIEKVYAPFLNVCLGWRFTTICIALAVFAIIAGYVYSGRIGMILMPRVDSDRAVVTAVLPYGSPLSKAVAVQSQLIDAMESVGKENGGDALLEGIFSLIDGNRVEVTAYLTDPDMRPLNTRDVTRLWRQQAGRVSGSQYVRFESDRGGPGGGAAISLELRHRDIEILDRASEALGKRLAEFPGVRDVDDGYTPGKRQFDFSPTLQGESLGLTTMEVARQVRNAFHGTIALRQQRGRNEVTVRVRLPEHQRLSEHDIESLLITTPGGRFVPLLQVAELQTSRAYTVIRRRDGRRTVTVTANVDPIGRTGQVVAALNTAILPQLMDDYPGLSYDYGGRQARRRESMQSLWGGFGMAMLAVFLLLAIPFRSYVQPLIIMIAVPFGIIGAVVGHIIMGYSLSVMSMMGIVALSGVVVNDALILINYANRQRRDGIEPWRAIRLAAMRRFRPIFLTTMTTFGGLSPMIFETSRQARFMIPMALSLGFGILFATVINLVLVPCLYLILEDARELGSRPVLNGKPV